jgi:hypothetical protein
MTRAGEQRQRPVCGSCGSVDIVFDAYVAWDVEAQEFELRSTFSGECSCGECDAVGSPTWANIEEAA